MSNLWPPAVDQKARCFRLENSSARLRLIRSGIWTHWFEASQNVRRGIGKRGRVKKVQTAEHVKHWVIFVAQIYL